MRVVHIFLMHFTDTKDGRGIIWGISHFTNVTSWATNHAVLTRFDCDLSQDINNPAMKQSNTYYKPDFYYTHGLNGNQRKRIEETN